MDNFNSVELVIQICKERKIPISRLEKDLGFCNAYLKGLKEGVFPSDRIKKISDYLDLPVEYLLTGVMPEKEKFDMPDYDSRIHDVILTFSDLNEYQKDIIIKLLKEMANTESEKNKFEKYYNAYLAINKGKNL